MAYYFRHRLSRVQYFLTSTFSFALAVGVWCLLTYGGLIDPFFLPPPTRILFTIVDLTLNQGLAGHIAISVFRVLVAFTLSALVAIPLGLLMSSFRRLQAAAEPPIDFIRYLPVPALVPLTILWFGIGETSKIFLLFFGTFFQLVLLVMDDADNVPVEYFEVASTLGASKRQMIMNVLLPCVMPNVFDDLRITLGWCWTYLLIGEMVAASSGVGHLIQQAQRYAKSDVVMSGVVVIGVIGIVSDACFKRLGHILFPYKARG
jgi:NitT/TauT family transport system permease protein